MVKLASLEPLTHETAPVRQWDVEAELNPTEAEGIYRDSTECAALALVSGTIGLLLSPPTPRPKKG